MAHVYNNVRVMKVVKVAEETCLLAEESLIAAMTIFIEALERAEKDKEYDIPCTDGEYEMLNQVKEHFVTYLGSEDNLDI